MPEILSPAGLRSRWTVVCLCAAWCDSCGNYRRAFSERAQAAGDAVHLWVDIEDESDWLGDIDVETFPTLLVLCGEQPMFFGPVLPQIGVVERTLRSLRESGPVLNELPAELAETITRLIESTRDLRG
jgi:hypothetical protein